MKTTPKYGPAIRAARESRGWSQNQLAKAMGTLPHRISEWEHDRPRASTETLFRIGEALGYTVLVTAEGVEFLTPPGEHVAAMSDQERK